MEVSDAARQVCDMFTFYLIKEETELYTRLSYFIDLKVKSGQRLMTLGANEANIKKCLTQCELLDSIMEPIIKDHNKVVKQLKAYGIIVNHN